MKFKATIEVIYEVKSNDFEDFYGTTNPLKIAEIDLSNFNNDVRNIMTVIQGRNYTVKVEPIE